MNRSRTDWSRYFSKGQIAPETVREVVNELATARQHEEVIACLQQAIIHGQIQPWMYEVLALSMRLAGRPDRDVERVLLSSEDVTPADPASQLYLAAYLTRFDRFDQALRLYRQVTLLEPNHPEAYSLALPLAIRTRHWEAIAWSAPGVLRYVWRKDRGPLVRQAEAAAKEAREEFLKAGRSDAALDLERQMEAARIRDLVVRLDWSGDGDLDLLVQEPGGSVCSRQIPYSSGGGVHLFDGYGPDPARCHEDYVCPQGAAGEYVIRIRHLTGNIVGKRATLTITRRAGSPREETSTHTVNLGAEDKLVRVSLASQLTTGAGPLRAPANLRLTEQSDRARLAARASIPNLSAQVAPQLGGAAPAVGPGAVGYQPIVQFIGEGVSMGAMAVVSGDRRYVRLSLSPTFSSITDVFTFSFVGSGGTGGGGGNGIRTP